MKTNKANIDYPRNNISIEDDSILYKEKERIKQKVGRQLSKRGVKVINNLSKNDLPF